MKNTVLVLSFAAGVAQTPPVPQESKDESAGVKPPAGTTGPGSTVLDLLSVVKMQRPILEAVMTQLGGDLDAGHL